MERRRHSDECMEIIKATSIELRFVCNVLASQDDADAIAALNRVRVALRDALEHALDGLNAECVNEEN